MWGKATRARLGLSSAWPKLVCDVEVVALVLDCGLVKNTSRQVESTGGVAMSSTPLPVGSRLLRPMGGSRTMEILQKQNKTRKNIRACLECLFLRSPRQEPSSLAFMSIRCICVHYIITCGFFHHLCSGNTFGLE